MSEDAGDWLLIGLDEKLAKKQGVPSRIPVPKGEFESLADKGMTVDQMRGWVSKFITTSPAMHNASWRTQNAALARSFEVFVAKKDSWAKAQEAFGKNDFKAAVGALRMISNIDPNDHCAKLNLASALSSSGDHPAAIAMLDSVTETWADDAEFHVTRANVLLSLQRRDEAIGALVDALERDPSHNQAMETLKALGVLAAVYEDPRDATSLTYVRTDKVTEHMESVWAAAPRDVDYYLRQVAYHQMERRPAVALAAAEKAIALAGAAGPDVRAVSARITALRELGRVDEATAAARAVVEKDASSGAAHLDLARCLLAAGKNDEANAELDRAIAADPGDLMALDLRWWPASRHDLEQLEAALPMFQGHADAHSTSAGAWRMLARARLAIGDAERAMPLFEKAVAMAPGDDDLRAEWWAELVRHGKAAEVIADAEKLGDMKKHDWKARWNHAEAFAAAGRKIEAQTVFASINHDESLHLDVRKRAKRAAMGVGGGT
ncbi:MAG TPA: tetratricopeptide repeat protein [Polyangiaceae bacterium]|jgi:tetratricopeptide (TPR) repeat protein